MQMKGRRSEGSRRSPHIAWESRHAAFGELLITKGNGRADRRRASALLVAETGADCKLDAAGEPHQQGAQPPLVPPRPRLVADHQRLGVAEALDLQQCGRSAGLVA